MKMSKKISIMVFAGSLLMSNAYGMNLFGGGDDSKNSKSSGPSVMDKVKAGASALIKIGTKVAKVGIDVSMADESMKLNEESALDVFKSLPEDSISQVAEGLKLSGKAVAESSKAIKGLIEVVYILDTDLLQTFEGVSEADVTAFEKLKQTASFKKLKIKEKLAKVKQKSLQFRLIIEEIGLLLIKQESLLPNLAAQLSGEKLTEAPEENLEEEATEADQESDAQAEAKAQQELEKQKAEAAAAKAKAAKKAVATKSAAGKKKAEPVEEEEEEAAPVKKAPAPAAKKRG